MASNKRQSHTQFLCTLHSMKEQNWNNSSHFSKWQGKKLQSHAHTQNFKSLFLLFRITINKNTHTIKSHSFHSSKSQKQKERMCTHLKPCITPNFISQQMFEVIELHKDTLKPKNNLKQISSKLTTFNSKLQQISK
jgi:hypothetical protein